MILHGDCLEVLKTLEPDSIDSMVTDPPAGISFMGKAWDGDMGGRDHWVGRMTFTFEECLRVLKPGAHALVWALPRTSHWTATALENAGFEIRDIVVHAFGSGFPKSLDISKAIDKAAGAERIRVPIIDVSTGKAKSANIDGGMFKPGKEFTTYSNEGVTDAAKQWAGWGTALKPASEHWILCRKPIGEKTVAANVLKWGVGGLNIDGCRIDGQPRNPGFKEPDSGGIWGSKDNSNLVGYQSPTGRFPANLVLSHHPDCLHVYPDGSTGYICIDDCAVRLLDEQSGISKGHASGYNFDLSNNDNATRVTKNIKSGVHFGDSGGASRFFYCAKVSPSERGTDNKHPTVKAQKLMSYLIRMVTPPGGLVLDPFAGSGSTGVAALKEGFRFVGVEREAEYVAIAEKRLEAVSV